MNRDMASSIEEAESAITISETIPGLDAERRADRVVTLVKDMEALRFTAPATIALEGSLIFLLTWILRELVAKNGWNIAHAPLTTSLPVVFIAFLLSLWQRGARIYRIDATERIQLLEKMSDKELALHEYLLFLPLSLVLVAIVLILMSVWSLACIEIWQRFKW
ncbi:hypothetical protein CDD80_2498 [Ophiocordyceps camponoti-rufipedis]|uniref:Uncharacterized protein n=1 Tax=Ophiocordyceps camponoti-rufipedis TaxID=2004952 RepID=A0A2C5Z7X8_9HYPO|nr:hypothetical protein CDD80_2498 [Ophiocordyceps camponoti-rufipedis]